MYTIGQKYKRIRQIGVGEPFMGLKFNSFKIISISKKYVTIGGAIASNLLMVRKIQTKDFPIFLKKYEETNL